MFHKIKLLFIGLFKRKSHIKPGIYDKELLKKVLKTNTFEEFAENKEIKTGKSTVFKYRKILD